MKYRKLRIAWSVTWGIVAVLLIALWVRSYWWVTNIQFPPLASRTIQCTLLTNKIFVRTSALATPPQTPRWLSTFSNVYKTDPDFAFWNRPFMGLFGITFNGIAPGSISVCFPYWCAATIASGLATAPWLSYRFSLRTLLIATTLVAVGLGLIVWL